MTRTPGLLPTIRAVGFQANPGDCQAYVEFVRSRVAGREPTSIYYLNLHSLYYYLRDESIRTAFDKAVLMADGMPIVALLRLSGAVVTRKDRLTWVDFIWPLLRSAAQYKQRVFYFGAAPDVLDVGLAKIRSALPDLCIDGHHGFIDVSSGGSDSHAVLAKMAEFRPDVCIVGMGTPRQELWVDGHRAAIPAPVVLTAGACIEYVAGAVRTPPRWMGRWGLEWAFRVLENPRRFAVRYFVEPWWVLALLLRAKLSGRR